MASNYQDGNLRPLPLQNKSSRTYTATERSSGSIWYLKSFFCGPRKKERKQGLIVIFPQKHPIDQIEYYRTPFPTKTRLLKIGFVCGVPWVFRVAKAMSSKVWPTKWKGKNRRCWCVSYLKSAMDHMGSLPCSLFQGKLAWEKGGFVVRFLSFSGWKTAPSSWREILLFDANVLVFLQSRKRLVWGQAKLLVPLGKPI